ncbi:alpha/beta hydrolase [Streptomyces sp. NPDC002577]
MPYSFDDELSPIASMLPPLHVRDVTAARATLAAMGGPDAAPSPPPGVTAEWATVPGAPDVQVLVMRPRKASGPLPAVLYMHGGGYVLGSAGTMQDMPALLAGEAGVLVASVDYRLAPEHPYPAAPDDCYAALVWLAKEAATLGAAPERIAVAGTSAGAGIAAAVALMARDRGGPPLCFQLLDSPMLDDSLTTSSARAFTDAPLWASSSNEDAWRHYLGARAGEPAPPYAAAARATDLTGLPPAFVAVAAHDPLRDEGIDYARRLTDAGVLTELVLYPGTFHGSSGAVREAAVSRRARADLVAAVVQGVAP